MSVVPRVLGKRLLVKPLDANEATVGGVVLPEEVRGKESRGMIVGIGEDLDHKLFEIGDVVVYAEHGSTSWTHPITVSVDNDETGKAETYVVVAIEDVLLVLEEAEVPAR